MTTKSVFVYRDSQTKNDGNTTFYFTGAEYAIGANETVSYEYRVIAYEPATGKSGSSVMVGVIKSVSSVITQVGSTTILPGNAEDSGFDANTLEVGTDSGKLALHLSGTATGKTINLDVWATYFVL